MHQGISCDLFSCSSLTGLVQFSTSSTTMVQLSTSSTLTFYCDETRVFCIFQKLTFAHRFLPCQHKINAKISNLTEYKSSTSSTTSHYRE